MTHPQTAYKAYYERYFGQLEGATITKVEMLPGEFDEFYLWPTFTAKLRDGTEVRLELSQDEEGNGPGFMFGLPSVPPMEVPS